MNWKLIGLVAGVVVLVLGALYAAGAQPFDALWQMVKGSLGSMDALGNTLREATPLLIAGLAVFLALKAGLFNIGVEGQFLAGALSSVTVALRFPGITGVLLGLLAGVVAGGLWALPAGLIKAYRNGHEVITTIMLNNVAGYLTSALVTGALKDPKAGEATTRILDDGTRLPMMMESPVAISWAIPMGLVLAVVLWWWLSRTVAGYELRATGANRTAAAVAGIDTKKVTMLAMSASGALAGLAGALQVFAYEHRFYQEFSPGYGFDALGVALLAGNTALGVAPAALLFGVLSNGGTALAINGIPKGITTVIMGSLILVAAAIRYRKVKNP